MHILETPGRVFVKFCVQINAVWSKKSFIFNEDLNAFLPTILDESVVLMTDDATVVAY